MVVYEWIGYVYDIYGNIYTSPKMWFVFDGAGSRFLDEEQEKDTAETSQKNTNRIPGYDGSVVPKYESITGSPQVATPLFYEQYDAEITIYFYDSNEEEKDEYIEYLLNNGWTKNEYQQGEIRAVNVKK